MVERGEDTVFGCRGFWDMFWEGILFLSRAGGGKEGEHSPYPVPGIRISQRKSQLK
jgi:hypothetical protein